MKTEKLIRYVTPVLQTCRFGNATLFLAGHNHLVALHSSALVLNCDCLKKISTRNVE
jgi:hypothetical protein